MMNATESATGDRRRELQAFDDTKAGVKGLVDAGVTALPPIFRHPPEALEGITSATGDVGAIPTIDLSAAHRGDVISLLRQAAGTVGFFQVVNHGVPAELMAGMLAGVRRFNEGPAEAKRALYASPMDLARKVGYTSNFDLYKSAAASWRDTLFVELVPDPPASEELPEALRGMVFDYGDAVSKVALRVLELLSESLGLRSDHLREMGCAQSISAVCQYYPPCPEPHLTFGTKRHTDPVFLTVLLHDGTPGLQVRAAGTWVDVPHHPGALLINIGDLLQLVSNDQFRSAEHRVLANKSKDRARVSVAAFFNADRTESTRLCAPITDEHSPAVYRAVTAQEFFATFNKIGVDGRALDLYRLDQQTPPTHAVV